MTTIDIILAELEAQRPGLGPSATARLLGISRSQLARYADGRTSPTERQLVRFCERLRAEGVAASVTIDADGARQQHSDLVDQIVGYDHPYWGPCRGKVLAAAGDKLLVQDLFPGGAREYWPVADVTVDAP